MSEQMRAVIQMIDVDSLRESPRAEVHAIADVLSTYTLAVAHLMTEMSYRDRGATEKADAEAALITRIHDQHLPEWAKWRNVKGA